MFRQSWMTVVEKFTSPFLEPKRVYEQLAELIPDSVTYFACLAPPAMPGARTGDHRPRERPIRLAFFGKIAALAADGPGCGPIAVAGAGGS